MEKCIPSMLGVFFTSIISLEHNATQPLGRFLLTVPQPCPEGSMQTPGSLFCYINILYQYTQYCVEFSQPLLKFVKNF